jgi:hypothetical protein
MVMRTVTDTSAAIRDCKQEISAAVIAALDKLRESTGISPERIDVDLADVTRATSPHREFTVVNVLLGFDV